MKNDVLASINKDIKSKKTDKRSYEKNHLSAGIEAEIFDDLRKTTSNYSPKNTFDIIHNFVSDNNNFNRALFSEIISRLYSLDDDTNGIFITNLKELKNYSDSIQKDELNNTKKFIVKLYDYVHLFNFQDYKVQKFFATKIEQSKSDLEDEVKKLQGQYISILGIFASFVVTFVGSLSFSSSILSSMSSVSIHRLFIVILLLGFIMLTICLSLYWFITKIVNNVDVKDLKNIYKLATFIIIFLMTVCLLLWSNGFVEKRNKSIEDFLKSTKSELAK